MTNLLVSKMLSKPEWDNRETLIEFLAAQLNRGSLTLVLGAGVSAAFGFADWEGLVNAAFRVAGKKRPADLGAQHAAERLFSELGGREDAFAATVREALYADTWMGGKITLAQLRQNDLLAAIGALAMASKRGGVNRIVTFNFDDLLEVYLRFHGFDVRSEEHMPAWHTSHDVTVFHPHGLLTSQGAFEYTSPIVFTQAHYDKIVGREQNPWRSAIVNICQGSTCIFIGLSGMDNNVSSILNSVNETHAAKQASHAYWGVRLCKADDQMNDFWEGRGVFPQSFIDYNEYPDFLFEICQQAAAKRERHR